MFGGAAFRQDGKVLAPVAGHVPAHGSFDQAGHQLGDKIDENEGFDPGVLFEEQRGNLQQGFEEAVAFFQVRLVFVGPQYLERDELGVGGQGKDAIHGLGAGDAGQVALRLDFGDLFDGAAEAGARGRMPAVVLPEAHGLLELDFHLDPILGVAFGQHLVGGLLEGGGVFASAAFGVVQSLQAFQRCGDLLLPVVVVAPAFFRGAIPMEGEAFLHLKEPLGQLENLPAALVAGAALAPERSPANPVGQAVVGESPDLTAGARQDGDKAPVLPIDPQEGFAHAQLAVGDIDEVALAQQTAQRLPDLPMGGIVGLVAVVGLVMNGDGSVGGDTQAVNQLLEIRAVVFAEAPAQLNGSGELVGVGPGKLDRGGIVMDARGIQVEMLQRAQGQMRQQTGPIRFKEPVQGPADGVVADGSRSDPARVVLLAPRADAVEGVGFDQQTLDQQFESRDISPERAALGQNLPQLEGVQKVLEDGQRPDGQGAQPQRIYLHGGYPNCRFTLRVVPCALQCGFFRGCRERSPGACQVPCGS